MLELKKMPVPVDAQLADPLLLCEPERVIEYAEKATARAVCRFTQRALRQLLQKTDRTFAESVALLSCDRNLLLTPAIVEQRRILQLRREITGKFKILNEVAFDE